MSKRKNYPDVIKRIPFEDPQFFADCEQQAIDGTLDYDKFPPAEYKYFSKLSKLGYMNRHKGWSKEICEARQREIKRDYNNDRGDREFFGKIAGQMQDNIKRGECLTWEINKNHDPIQMLKLALECIGCMTGNTWFTRFNLEKLESDKNA